MCGLNTSFGIDYICKWSGALLPFFTSGVKCWLLPWHNYNRRETLRTKRKCCAKFLCSVNVCWSNRFCKKNSYASVWKCHAAIISYVSQYCKRTLCFRNLYLEGMGSILSAICRKDLTFLAYLGALRIIIEPAFFFLYAWYIAFTWCLHWTKRGWFFRQSSKWVGNWGCSNKLNMQEAL